MAWFQEESYVTVGYGRSYRDVPPNRGIYQGGAASESLEVEVLTSPGHSDRSAVGRLDDDMFVDLPGLYRGAGSPFSRTDLAWKRRGFRTTATTATTAVMNTGVEDWQSEEDWSPQIAHVLKEVWGFDALRPLQQDAIEANLRARDSLLVMPTGGGKSLTYQLPSLLLEGLTVVASPLISLMKDQVDGLVANGVPAVSLHSGQDEQTRHHNRQQIQSRQTKLLYVSPELLVGGSLNGLLRTVGVRAFAIDEAHCISHWGHDFRPEYRRLADLRGIFPEASFHACTATATPQVRQDILEALVLSDPSILVGDFDRPNLTLRIRRREGGRDQLVEEVRRHDGEGVIVYALSRKDTEQIASRLCKEGMTAKHYHAGLSSRERDRVQTQFAREEVNIVVATVAFGMGIDRSNIRAVIHASMPRSIEHYQQETGQSRTRRRACRLRFVPFLCGSGSLASTGHPFI